MEIGTICIKIKGRDAGRQCVVVDVKGDRILVTGPKGLTGVRRRAVNPSHLRRTPQRIDIKPNASDEDVAKVLGKKVLPPRPHPAKEGKREEKKEERKEAPEKKEEKKGLIRKILPRRKKEEKKKEKEKPEKKEAKKKAKKK